MSKISIIIVNWNTGELLNNCLRSIMEHGEDYFYSVIVVDNASQDDSHLCADSFKNTKLISLDNNYGFAKACNIGAKEADSDYFLFLNPDTEIKDNTLRTVYDYMELEANKNIGICGITLTDLNGLPSISCSRFPTLSRHFFYSIGLSKIFPLLSSPMQEFSHNKTKEVDQVMGAFFFIRSSLFKALEGFDERFFVYYEEVDLSYRAFQNKWKTIFLSETSAYHLGGGSSSNVKAKRLFYSQRSRILYAKKHFNCLKLFFTMSIIFLIEPISRITSLLLHGSKYELKEFLKGYSELISWIPDFFITKH
jgi:GT2 family glycosyltransferase